MQYLDFSALENNALFFKKLLGVSKLCAVIKHDAYGHGAVHVARYLDSIVDFYAVGSVAEAKQISFVSKDILILLPQNADDTLVSIRNGYILSVDGFQTLDTIKSITDKMHLKARVHIKIDSGMSRLGFAPSEVDKLLDLLQNSPNIAVEGVYSHFYGENSVDCDKQFDKFLPCAETLEKGLNRPMIKHISNTAGALLSSKYHLDLARIGFGLYGYGNTNLTPVKTVTANVIAVKSVCEGSAVGYGAKYIAPTNIRVAVLNVGYAQGFSRALVGSCVQVNSVKLKVVAVCMGMTIVDIGDIDVKVGDVATLLGNGVNASNDVVSTYELLCNLK